MPVRVCEDRDMHSAKNMLVFGLDKRNIIKSSGVERISAPVEHKATVTEPYGAVTSLCNEAGGQPHL